MRGPGAGIHNSVVLRVIFQNTSNTNVRAFINSWNSIAQTCSHILSSTAIFFYNLSAILGDLDHPLSRFQDHTSRNPTYHYSTNTWVMRSYALNANLPTVSAA